MTSKAVEVADLVKTHKPDIVVATETWLKGDSCVNLHGYSVHYANRPTQCSRGEGGVAIFAKSHLVVRPCEASAHPDLLWVKVHLPQGKPLLVGGFYGPQESVNKREVSECYRILQEELIANREEHVVLMGDFNAKIGKQHPRVGSFGPTAVSRNGSFVHKLLDEQDLYTHNAVVPEGTHTTRHMEGATPAMLDLIISDRALLTPRGAQALQKVEFGSDHLVVEATLDIARGSQQKKHRVHKRWNREKLLRMVEAQRADTAKDPPPTEFEVACTEKLKGWIEQAKAFLQTSSTDATGTGDSDNAMREGVENLWKSWGKLVNEAGMQAVGQKTISNRSRSFIDDEAAECIRERRNLFNTASANPTPTAWNAYLVKRKETAKVIYAKKQASWEEFSQEIVASRKTNPKRFWSLLRRLDKSKRRQATVELNRADGAPCVSNAEVLEEFTQHFATVGLNTPGAVFDREWQKEVEQANMAIVADETTLSREQQKLLAPITVASIVAALQGVPNGKATGRDGIPTEFLKHGGVHMRESLALLFEVCQRTECTPNEWHLVNVVPIFKKGNKYDRGNYRRVSLLSCVYKLYARVLQQRLSVFLKDRIVEEQAGFTPGKGCDDNLCIMTEVMERKIANREPLYVALVDMRAAFDTVWREGIWHKLSEMDVPNKLIRILREIYSHGKFRVVANGEEGPDVDAMSAGVLQGDVLSPDLFKAFINDLPQFMEDAGCTGVDVSELKKVVLLLFADDILLWGCTQNELQLQLDSLRDYCRKWQLEVSAPKTKVLLSPHARPQGPLKYDGADIEVVDSHPYLGVHFQGDTKWDSMIKKTVKKALSRQAALCSILTNRQIPMTMRYAIWTTVVRPILEWGVEVYTPPNPLVLERVQRSALRMIYGAQMHAPVVVLEGDIGAQSIQSRMDQRKCALLGKLKLAKSDSLLGQVQSNLEGRRVRGSRTVHGELKRLNDSVLKPAALDVIAQDDDENVSFKSWKGDVKYLIRELDHNRRLVEAQNSSSLSDLMKHSGLSTQGAHPYTLSKNGKAASLWFKIRSNTLPLGRLLAKMSKGTSDKCQCCGEGRETIIHFLSDCAALESVRSEWLIETQAEDLMLGSDIPRLVLGTADSLRVLPFENLSDAVSAVERLLMQLWKTRNALHNGNDSTHPASSPTHDGSQDSGFAQGKAQRGSNEQIPLAQKFERKSRQFESIAKTTER